MDEKRAPSLCREDDDERSHIPVMTSRMLALRAAQLVFAIVYATLDAFAALRLQFGSVRRHNMPGSSPKSPNVVTDALTRPWTKQMPAFSKSGMTRTLFKARPELTTRSPIVCCVVGTCRLLFLARIQHRAASETVPLDRPLVSQRRPVFTAEAPTKVLICVCDLFSRTLEITTNLTWLASWAMLAVLATGLNQMQNGMPAGQGDLRPTEMEASTPAQQVSNDAMEAARIIVAAASAVGMLAWGLLTASLISTSEPPRFEKS